MVVVRAGMYCRDVRVPKRDGQVSSSFDDGDDEGDGEKTYRERLKRRMKDRLS